MIISNTEETRVEKGNYNIQMNMSTGDAKLQYTTLLGGTAPLAFIDIPNSVNSASTGFILSLPSCYILPVVTGNAVISLTKLE